MRLESVLHRGVFPDDCAGTADAIHCRTHDAAGIACPFAAGVQPLQTGRLFSSKPRFLNVK